MLMTNRRGFLLGASAAAAAFGVSGCRSMWGSARSGRRPAASERVTLAVIGCGAMAKGNMDMLMADPRVQVVAVCDPILSCLHAGYTAKETSGRRPFKELVDAHYGTRDCRMAADWREVVADPAIDAVLITTPDHWHAPIAIAAMRAGKHVYCQKPMTMGVNEGKTMVRVAKESGVVFQVGSQQRSMSEFRVAAELVRNGYLEGCSSCSIGLIYPHNDSRQNGYPRDPRRAKFPDYFESKEMWDLWQGPARHWEDDAFIPGIHGPVSWRWNWRTGGGTVTDWGAHHLDSLQWALGTELSGPVAIENVVCDFQPPDSSIVAPDVFATAYRFGFDVVYANGFRAHVGDTDAVRQGLTFHAPKGDLFVTRGKIELPPALSDWNEKTDLKDSDIHLHKTRSTHESDFIDGIYTGAPVACPCEIGHRSVTIAHLANICIRLGRKGLKWDPRAEHVVGDAEADALLEVPHENGYGLNA